VKDQIHIRNAEAKRPARALARQTGKTESQVVLEALRQYRSRRQQPVPQKQIELWRRLLREDRRRGAVKPAMPVEALYDESSGLPA
jgi:hypothetical protein